MSATHILSAVRSPIGRFGGSLAALPAVDWGSKVVLEAIRRAGLQPDQIELLIAGQVIQAGHGITLARKLADRAGIPETSVAQVINQACASGMASVQVADRMIRLGEAQAVVAGGIEHMSAVPYLVPGARWGQRYGHGQLQDELQNCLTCPVTDQAMGETAEEIARRYGISREEQDQYAAESHRKALEARERGWFDPEILPLEIPEGKKGTRTWSTDEQPRDPDLEALGRLRPAFDRNGSVTAGNSSGINDGAAFLVLASESVARESGAKVLGVIRATASVGIDPRIMGMGPVPALRKALDLAGWKPEEVDLWDINEAFSVQMLGVLRELPIPVEKLNIHGGGVALGHPVGASGARVLTTLLHALERTGGRRGAAALCVGGGMGIATLVERI